MFGSEVVKHTIEAVGFFGFVAHVFCDKGELKEKENSNSNCKYDNIQCADIGGPRMEVESLKKGFFRLLMVRCFLPGTKGLGTFGSSMSRCIILKTNNYKARY